MISILGLLLSAALAPAAHGEEKSNTPYIDSIREELKQQDSQKQQDSESYTEKLKKQIQKRDEEKKRETGEPADKPYIDQLREEDPSLQKKPVNDYIDKKKATIPPEKQGGAIDAFNRGQSELHAKQTGEITGAFGFKLGAASNNNISAGDSQARNFSDVYSGWAPQFQLYYEWQPWHSEFWGNVGLVGSIGVSYFNGFGKFKFAVPKGCQAPGPCTPGSFFPEDSETRFSFWEAPVWVGLDYRFNLFKYVRPFVMAGPMALVWFESRDDDQPGFRGVSKSFYASGGVSILLDWISPSQAWDLYMEHGIHHYYLTLDYSKITTFASTVNFDVSTFNIGLAFEF